MAKGKPSKGTPADKRLKGNGGKSGGKTPKPMFGRKAPKRGK